MAARYGHANVAKILVTRNANLEAKNKENITALHIACHGHKKECLSIVNMIINHGGNVNVSNGLYTPLGLATEFYNFGIFKALIAMNANVNCRQNVYRRLPLHEATCQGHTEAVVLLLQHPEHDRKNVNVQDDNGCTPLWLACGYYQDNYVDIIRILIEQGADLNVIDFEEGNSPLLEAAKQYEGLIVDKRKALVVAELLIAHEADTTIRNKHGKQFLDYIDREQLKKEFQVLQIEFIAQNIFNQIQ